MDSNIFRKVALERLSSPEQLDQVMHTTSPKLWVALLAVLLLLGAAVVWGYEGSIPTKAGGEGVLVRTGGVLNVVALGNGVVLNLTVNAGDQVKANQVVGRIAQPDLVQKIRDTREVLAQARSRESIVREMHVSTAKLQAVALSRQRENAQKQIVVFEDQIKLLQGQLPAEQQLLERGLITKHQLVATQQKIVELQGQIATEQANINQLDAQQSAIQSEPVEADEDARARVLDLQTELDVLEQELKTASNVTTPYAGEVLEVKVLPGGVVTSGTPLLSIQPDVRHLEVIAYIGSREAKDVRPNMQAEISPSTVKREEFGYLRGKVVAVADFPATPEAMMRNFENLPLVESIARAGPVTELRIRLESDRTSISGYVWSSPKSPPVTLSSGTLCTVEVVTKRQRPITLLLPWFKNNTGLT